MKKYAVFFNCLLLFFTTSVIQGQSNTKICEDGQCSDAVFSIQLNEPLKPITGTYTSERTENYKTAFLEFQKIKASQSQNSDWKKSQLLVFSFGLDVNARSLKQKEDIVAIKDANGSITNTSFQ